MDDLPSFELFDPVEFADLRQRVVGRLFDPGGPIQIDRYTVLEKLGAGGMGVVYAAYDPKLDRRVALKLLNRRAKGGELASRLLREAKALAKLAHPNVVTVFDAGQWEGRVFIAMEYLPGPTVSQWVAEARPGAREILEAFIGAGEGLSAAHDAGLIHRDFKPSNVMFAADGRVRVVDFGLVRTGDEGPVPTNLEALAAEDLALTQTGAILGTPAYMAPEQFEDSDVDAPADQFAFAVSLFEMLTGDRPFRGETAAQTLEAINRRSALPPIKADVPGRLDATLARALDPQPHARYPSMAALLDELRSKLAPRRRSRAAALGSIALGLLAAASIAYAAVRAPEAPSAPLAAWSETYVEARDEQAREASATALGRATELVEHDPTQALALLEGVDTDDPRAAELRSQARAFGVASARQAKKFTIFDATEALATSPGVFVLGSKGRANRLWDPQTVVPSFLHWGSVQTTADGSRLVTCCGEDEVLAVWDPRSGELIETIPAAAAGLAPLLELSWDGTHAVWVDDRAHLVRLADGTTADVDLDVDVESLVSLTPTNDGTTVIALDQRRLLRALDVESGQARQLGVRISLAYRVVVMDRFVAAIDESRRLRVWSLDEPGEMKVSARDADWLAAAPDRTLWTWSIVDGMPTLRHFDPHTATWMDPQMPTNIARPAQAAFSRDGRRAAFALEDGTVTVWDLERRIQWSPRLPAKFNAVTFNADATAILTLDSDRNVLRWPLPWIDDRYRRAHEGVIVELEPSTRGLLTAAEDGRVIAWDTQAWTESESWDFGPDVPSVDAAKDGTLVVAHGRKISRLRPDATQWELVAERPNDVRGVGISPAGDELLWVEGDLDIFESPLPQFRPAAVPHLCPSADDGNPYCSRHPEGPVTEVFYSPHGERRGIRMDVTYVWYRETNEGFVHHDDLGFWMDYGDSIIAGQMLRRLFFWDGTGDFPPRRAQRVELVAASSMGTLAGQGGVAFVTPQESLEFWIPHEGSHRWLSATMAGNPARLAASGSWVAVADEHGGFTIYELDGEAAQ